jgi:pimeloyl-ACP methyl ester carboxylesterase
VPAPELDPAASTRFVEVGGACLRTATWGAGPATVVLLHDGLGSIGQWRDVPRELHRMTGATVMAYERAGHGASTPVPDGPWPADWLHREAEVLVALLDTLEIDAPTLVGHSDGGSIALLAAAAAGERCRAAVVLAAHTWVEDVCVESIHTMRAGRAHIVRALDQHHDAPGAVFDAWSGAWVSEDFAPWDVRPLLRDIDCPVLAVQGTRDEYATDAQLTTTVAAIGPNAQLSRVVDGRHVLHHSSPQTVIELVAAFYDQHGSANSVAQRD